jgi:hypothetical protein
MSRADAAGRSIHEISTVGVGLVDEMAGPPAKTWISALTLADRAGNLVLARRGRETLGR